MVFVTNNVRCYTDCGAVSADTAVKGFGQAEIQEFRRRFHQMTELHISLRDSTIFSA